MAETILTDALDRKIAIRDLNIEEQLDLMEALGENSANPGYVNFASLIYLVASIDDKPLPKPTRKEHFRRNAVLLKNEGMAALLKHVGEKAEEVDTSAGVIELAKN